MVNMSYQDGKNIVFQAMYSMYNLYRKYNTPIQSEGVFLFILYLCRNKLFDINTNHWEQNASLVNNIGKVIVNFSRYEDNILQRVWEIYVPEFNTLSNSDAKYLYHNIILPLSDISEKWYYENYPLVFDEILQYSIALNGKYSEFINQPEEVTKLVKAISNFSNGGMVYNPFAGTASYCIEFGAESYYVAQELNRNTWAIGVMRLLANGFNTNNYLCEDSIEDWKANYPNRQYNKSRYDLVVATPPFGMKLNRKLEYEYEPYNKITTVEEVFIHRGLTGLTSNGQLIGVFQPRVLFASGLMQYIRRSSISKDLLDTVISLPQNLFSSTTIPTVILLFSKRKEIAGHVKMVDGSSFFEKKGRSNVLKWEEIYKAIQNSDSQFVRLVPNRTIVDNEYNITPGLYLNEVTESIDIPEGFELRKLKELVSVYKGSRATTGEFRMVRGKDLAEDRFSFDKTFEELQLEGANDRFSVLDRDLLLVLRIGKLKPTYFHYTQGINVCCNSNILAFEFNTNIVNPQYLVNELGKGYVSQQVSARSNGAVMQSISLKDLLEIKILVPALDKQESTFLEDRQLYQEIKIKKLGIELNLLKAYQHSEFERNMRLRKHALTQVLNSFTPAFALLEKCKDKHNGSLNDNDIVASRTGETVAEYFNKMHQYIAKLEGLVDVLVDQQSYGEAELVWLEEFFENYRKRHLSNNYKIDLLLDNITDVNITIHEDEDNSILADEKTSNNAINICSRDLTQVIDNIVSNARKYGFIDLERKDYAIRIVIKEEEIEGNYMVTVKISNNGTPLHKGIDRTKFFHWGVGSGTGLGTWQIKNIVEHFGGYVTLNEYPDDLTGFTIEYELVFPKINTL